MQRGLGGFPHERLHQDGKRQEVFQEISLALNKGHFSDSPLC
ncbi:hypothetical protein [Moorena bouillonii]|nr:hypothetical protein [Moorena bouillonii]